MEISEEDKKKSEEDKKKSFEKHKKFLHQQLFIKLMNKFILTSDEDLLLIDYLKEKNPKDMTIREKQKYEELLTKEKLRKETLRLEFEIEILKNDINKLRQIKKEFQNVEESTSTKKDLENKNSILIVFEEKLKKNLQEFENRKEKFDVQLTPEEQKQLTYLEEVEEKKWILGQITRRKNILVKFKREYEKNVGDLGEPFKKIEQMFENLESVINFSTEWNSPEEEIIEFMDQFIKRKDKIDPNSFKLTLDILLNTLQKMFLLREKGFKNFSLTYKDAIIPANLEVIKFIYNEQLDLFEIVQIKKLKDIIEKYIINESISNNYNLDMDSSIAKNKKFNKVIETKMLSIPEVEEKIDVIIEGITSKYKLFIFNFRVLYIPISIVKRQYRLASYVIPLLITKLEEAKNELVDYGIISTTVELWVMKNLINSDFKKFKLDYTKYFKTKLDEFPNLISIKNGRTSGSLSMIKRYTEKSLSARINKVVEFDQKDIIYFTYLPDIALRANIIENAANIYTFANPETKLLPLPLRYKIKPKGEGKGYYSKEDETSELINSVLVDVTTGAKGANEIIWKRLANKKILECKYTIGKEKIELSIETENLGKVKPKFRTIAIIKKEDLPCLFKWDRKKETSDIKIEIFPSEIEIFPSEIEIFPSEISDKNINFSDDNNQNTENNIRLNAFNQFSKMSIYQLYK